MRTLQLRDSSGRAVEARVIYHGDTYGAGRTNEGIVPLLEFVLAVGRVPRKLNVLPLQFALDRRGSELRVAGGGVELTLPRPEVDRLCAWIEGGGTADVAPVAIVLGDELEVGRACGVLSRMSLDLVRAERPGIARAALARDPALVVLAGFAPGAVAIVKEALAAGVPVLGIGVADEPELQGVGGIEHMQEIDQRRMFDLVGELLDLV